MGALRPAFTEPAPRRPEHDTSCDLRCTGRPLRRSVATTSSRVSGPRTAPDTACRRPRLVPSRSMPGRASGGAGCPVDGPRRRYNVDRETSRARARRFYTDVLSQLIGRLQEFVPSSRLIASRPRELFPHVDDQVTLFLSSFSSRAFRRSSLRTFSSSGFRSGLRPRFFDRAFSDPLCAALRHVVRCDEYRPWMTQAQDLTRPRRAPCTRSASSTMSQLVRRTEPPPLAAYLLPPGPQELPKRLRSLASPVPGARSPNMFVFEAAFALL